MFIRNSLLVAAFFSATLCLSGCGGGGGGSSSSTNTGTGTGGTPTTLTLTGTVTNSAGTPLNAVEVSAPAISTNTTTASNGTFSLVLPATVSGTSVIIDYYNSGNNIVSVATVPVTATAGNSQSIGTTAEPASTPPNQPG